MRLSKKEVREKIEEVRDFVDTVARGVQTKKIIQSLLTDYDIGKRTSDLLQSYLSLVRDMLQKLDKEAEEFFILDTEKLMSDDGWKGTLMSIK